MVLTFTGLPIGNSVNHLARQPYSPPPLIHEDNKFLHDHNFIATISRSIGTDSKKEEIFFEYNYDTDQEYSDTNQQPILTITNTSDLQKQCDYLKDLTNYIKHRELPKDDKTAKHIVFESEQYIVKNDALFHLYQPRIKHMNKASKSIKQS